MSGIHASTNLHVAERHKISDDGEIDADWYKFYYSVGSKEDRVKNLYLTYSLVLRALNLMKDQLIMNDYSAGLCSADATSSFPHIAELLTTTTEDGSCLSEFSSKAFYDGWRTRALQSEMMPKLQNFTSVLDCVSCDTSRLNGKV